MTEFKVGKMINRDELQTMLKESLFKNEELSNGKPPVEPIVVEGLVQTFGFHPARVTLYKERLKEMIDELDPKFTVGRGYTFLNLPFDKDQKLWGHQPDAEVLYVLARANGLAKYCMPRDMWDVLPGGVPYIAFSKEGFND